MIIIGSTYGNWKALQEVEKINRKSQFLCVCDCGEQKIVRKDDLIKSSSKYCRKCRHASVALSAGDIFGQWTVIREVEAAEKRKHYEVQCSCGNKKILKGIRLRFGDSLKCRVCGSTKHGMAYSTTYSSWGNMHQRCYNENHTAYKWYGGKGIKICDRWHEFSLFLLDMGERPDKTEIDRIDPNKNYEPGNCQWISHENNLKKITK